LARPHQVVEIKRRIPRQARSEETLLALLEGAAQVLEAGGLATFTTNAVAERAGVSIGTLYQYFADKNALVTMLAERELQATLANVAKAMSDDRDASAEQRVRGVVRAIVNAFHGRQRARKAVIQAVLSQARGVAFHAPVAAFIAAHSLEMLSREQTFVLSRALIGTIRSAVLEEQPFLKSRSFEDELVRLVLCYLGAVNAPPAATAPG
jgi:AcrR family transcriptional regulator